MAQSLRLSVPLAYPRFSSEDVELVGNHAIAAGGTADIWEATHDGRKVVLKSHRCYESSDIARDAERIRNEVHVHNLLRRGGVNVVPLLGVHSTEAHPFGIVYEYMDGLDLKQHLKNDPDVRKLKLLVGIAQDLSRMHDLGIVHSGLKATNILIGKDGAPHIAGLSSARVLHNSVALKEEAKENTGPLSRGQAPELAGPGLLPNMSDSPCPTKAGDVYSFGVVAFEVLTGRPPFSELTEIAATFSMLKGDRPSRRDNQGISNSLWHIIERCWHNTPSERMSMGAVVGLLEAELRRVSH